MATAMNNATEQNGVLLGSDRQDFMTLGPPKVTLIKSDGPANKEFYLDTTGALNKVAHGSIISGWGWSIPVPDVKAMVGVLETVTQTNNTVVCAGSYHYDHGGAFRIMPEWQLASHFNLPIGSPDIAGVVLVGDQPTAARLKRGIYPSAWILFDADNPPGIPDNWVAMNIQQRMEQWETLLPGLSQCERIELRSSSSRVRLLGDPEGQATHAWVRVSDPAKVSLMKAHLSIEMVNQGKSFKFEKHSRIDPESVVGIESRGVFDLAVFDVGRLTFCAAPTANIPGYVVDGPDIRIVNPGGGVLDISNIVIPGDAAKALYKKNTGIKLDMKMGGNGYLSITSIGQLTMETEIDIRDVIKRLSEWAVGLQQGEKIRCEAPFRESYSEAAFISINNKTGKPQVHDVGNSCTYMLAETAEDMFGPGDPAAAAAAEEQHLKAIAAKEAMENTVYVLPNDHYPISKAAPLIFNDLSTKKKLFSRDSIMVQLKEGALTPVTSDEFRSLMPELGKPLVAYKLPRNGGEPYLAPKQCSRDTATMLMGTTAARTLLPKVKAVVKYPHLALVDGRAQMLEKGWHDIEGGILVRHNRDIPAVPLSEAVAALLDVHRDFAFSTPGDKARAMAMLITPALVIGGFITDPIPVDVAEADQSQAGKGYRQKLVRGIYGERGHLIAKRNGGVGGIDESVGAGILSGNRFVSLDNVRGELDSMIMEAAITANGDTIEVRVPHQGNQMIDPSGICWQITSNGIDTTRDLANRSCIIRIKKQPEDYKWHNWDGGSLEIYIRRNQAYLMGCVHAVVMAWVDAGMPMEGVAPVPGHDMHVWARVVDWIVQNVFGLCNPMQGHREKQKQVSNPQLKWLRELSLAIAESGRMDSQMAANQLVNICEDHGVQWPRGHAPHASQVSQMVGRIMKSIFNDGDSVVIDHFTVTRHEVDYFNDEIGRAGGTKTYTFSEVG